MASKAKIVTGADPTQAEPAVNQKEGLLDSTREQEIRDRAYQIYLQRWRQPGNEIEDWLQAERELSANPRPQLCQQISKAENHGDSTSDKC